MSQVEYRTDERLTYEEHLEFLTRTDLGGEYPRLRFEQRIRSVLKNVDICVTARDGTQLVGVCLGLSDFAYWLFLTDLGVDRAYLRQGIGSRLVDLAWAQAGGRENIFAFTMANPDAIEFYRKCGLTPLANVVGSQPENWKLFDVRELADRLG